MRILPDVNALSIQLIDDHPGHPYVAEQLVPALHGEETLLLFGYLPLRVQWVLEDLGLSTVDARNAVSSLLQYPVECVDSTPDIVLDAYEISAEKNHDVYDCFYIALARQADADVIVTTDRDFEVLCEDEQFEYTNPVPEDVLSEFHQV
ncbi:type II toxin-antitoxin system VapC family toxin [Natranaeroarchaeum sulfidigenes]|uniref:PIN domain containing protein, often a toxin of type II toxin-antitoxin systems n=1 Tax=Natranaeroarchaeum sulfidigenes TaxID=2784880 RepID=A0A897MZ14_9EURY|nr:type II toxin-antitoxin system VapC family toxin [Natranaeroarchaeum sulfidigenes]QSG03605.1 PIN domain containing protein, often a toxin of type II toxin-antitoxin systems [Natranaeroarchaeum sulfidigenes]